MPRLSLKRCYLFFIILLLGFLSSCQLFPGDLVEAVEKGTEIATKQDVVPESISTSTLPAEPTATMTVQSSPTPAYTATPTLTPTPSFPEEYYITDIFGYRQWFSLSCEARAAVDWAGYFGVTIYEYNFQHELPLSDNPDFGFVGAVNGPWGQVPPYAYGVHAEPVAELLRKYDLKAKAYKKYTIDQIRAQIAEGKPVIAWVIGNVEGGVPYIYTDAAGNEVQVGAYEHVVIVTGYSEDSIRYLNNSRFYDVPVDVFDNSWSVLDRMVIVWED